MKFPLTYLSSRSPARRRVLGRGRHSPGKAFTLVELLVSITVLSVMVGMTGTMLSTMGGLWHDAQKRVNNFTKARSMLDMMTHDLQVGVYRSDLSAFPDLSAQANSPLAFYTLRSGVGATPRDVSLVGYSLDTTSFTLQRSSLYEPWATVLPPLNSSTTLGTPQDTAAGIVDFKLLFLHKDGTLTSSYTPNATNPVRAIAITLAVVDDQTFATLNQANKTVALNSALEAALPAGPTYTGSVKADWEAYLSSGGMNWNGYPKSLGVGLKIFERYVYLPNTF